LPRYGSPHRKLSAARRRPVIGGDIGLEDLQRTRSAVTALEQAPTILLGARWISWNSK
jgi:hypothetical protein